MSWPLWFGRSIASAKRSNLGWAAPQSHENGDADIGIRPCRSRHEPVGRIIGRSNRRTHAHGDHYGDANYLVEKYHPRVVMSVADWRELEKPVLQFDNVLWGRPPKRDMAVAEGHKLQPWDTTVDLNLTPGHTPGTLSVVFAAKDGSLVHRVLLWGGTGFNFGKNALRMRSYIASTRRMAGVVAQERIDVISL